MIVISTDAAMGALAHTAAEHPDRVAGNEYVTRRETRGGRATLTPCCLAGTALARLGVPPHTLEQHEYLQVGEILGALTELGEIAVERTAARALATAQAEQDHGATWAEALGHAEHAVRTW